jgi:hypothetical protein
VGNLQREGRERAILYEHMKRTVKSSVRLVFSEEGVQFKRN